MNQLAEKARTASWDDLMNRIRTLDVPKVLRSVGYFHVSEQLETAAFYALCRKAISLQTIFNVVWHKLINKRTGSKGEGSISVFEMGYEFLLESIRSLAPWLNHDEILKIAEAFHNKMIRNNLRNQL